LISRLLNPSSVAVVGAANDRGKLRGKLLALLIQAGFEGAVYPVNPGANEIQGLPAYPDLTAVPGPVDLVLIAVPGGQVPTVLDQAVQIGAGAAVIFSSGVPDISGYADRIRIMGPNTEGFYCPESRLAATFAQVVEHSLERDEAPPAAPRPLTIISQSGGLGFALYGRALAENLDVRSVITTGNEGDLECLDFVEHCVDQASPAVILLFIEGLKTPARLAEVAAKARAAGSSIVALKVGRSEAGQRAALSHTAHLAGADTAYDASFERAGVIRVHDLEESLAVAAALSRLPASPGQRVAIVTTSGGAGAWAADLCSAAGLEIPPLTEALQAEILPLIPSYGAAGNPVDVTAAAVEDGGKSLVQVVERLVASDEVDGVLVNMGLAAKGRVAALRPVLEPLLRASRKPIVFHSHILPSRENLTALAQAGSHGFSTLRAAALGLAALAKDGERLRRAPVVARSADRRPMIAAADGVLGEAETGNLLRAYDLPFPQSILAADADQCVAAAARIGGPVAMKIQSVDLPHKTEAGGVFLGVTAEDVRSTFERIIANARAYAPDARIEGVLVQQMARPGREVAVGMVRDPDFGPLVMLGAGGVYIEVLKDVVFAPAPIDRAEAMRLIMSLKTVPILKGVRGAPPGDLEALAELISRVGDLALCEAAIEQIDLNPVVVYPAGEGVMAVDALVSGKSSGAEPRH